MARLRFSVRRRGQTALFRKVRFFSPAQTPASLTEKRSLSRYPHVKAHSVRRTSRKSTLYGLRGLQDATLVTTLPQTALFRTPQGPECAFPYTAGARMRFSVKCAFSHLRKRGAASRKSALCTSDLTQKRTLSRHPHGKAHSDQEVVFAWNMILLWEQGIASGRVQRS